MHQLRTLTDLHNRRWLKIAGLTLSLLMFAAATLTHARGQSTPIPLTDGPPEAVAFPATNPGALAEIVRNFEREPLLAEGGAFALHAPSNPAALSPTLLNQPTDANDLWDDRFGAPGITCCVGFDFDAFTAESAPDGVYVGGSFDQLGTKRGTAAIARWDGRRWHSLDGGLYDGDSAGDVYDIAVDGDNVYAAGNFNEASGKRMAGVARWHIPSQEWFPVGTGDGPRDNDDEPISARSVGVVDGEVYIGGYFESVDGVAARRIARWDGTAWSPLAGGLYTEGTLDNDAIPTAIAGLGDYIYVGGAFEYAVASDDTLDLEVNNLARWNHTTEQWESVGGGTSVDVRVMTVWNDALYAGGAFEQAGDQTVYGIARWQDERWSPLGTGVDGYVDAIQAGPDGLYVSGGFYNAGEVENTDSLVRWDGSQWHSLGTNEFLSGADDEFISAMGVLPDGGILVSGDFGEAGTPLLDKTAFWDGTQWRGTGLGFEDDYSGFVGGDGYAVAVAPNGNVYVGGDFLHIGGLPYSHLAMWDGEMWHSVGGGVDGDVSALLIRGDDLYVAGGFAQVGGEGDESVPAVRVARWNMVSETWSAVGNGLPGGYVNDLAFVGETLYAGGAGFPFETECCLWKLEGDSDTWAPFSERFISDYFIAGIAGRPQTTVITLASDGEQLLVGGRWLDIETRANEQEVTKGDLFLYHPATDSVYGFGEGFQGESLVFIRDIEITLSGVYVGGEFNSIDGVAALGLAKLTADGWSSLGVSVLSDDDASVNAIESNGNELYVAGEFEQVGVEAYNVARLDIASNTWSALGCGITRNGETVSIERVADLAVQPAGAPSAGLYATGGIVGAGCVPSVGFAAWYGVGAGGGAEARQARIPAGAAAVTPEATPEATSTPQPGETPVVAPTATPVEPLHPGDASSSTFLPLVNR